jgi:hypothetical protein
MRLVFFSVSQTELMVPVFEKTEQFLKQLYILYSFVIKSYPCRLVVTKYSNMSHIVMHNIKHLERFITLGRIVA